MSWNGATSVEEWVVYQGGAEDKLSQVGRIRYKGFETQFGVNQACVQVAAVVRRKVSARSSVVCAFSNGTKRG